MFAARPRSFRTTLFLLFLLLFLTPFLSAHHPSYPAPLEFVPFQDEGWALISTSGFITSERPQELICKEAFGVPGRVYATVMGPTHFALATEEGLAVTRDGCDPSADHILSGQVIDLDSRGEILIALEARADADGIHVSFDGGDTLEHLLDLPEDLKGTTVKVLNSTEAVIAVFDNGITTRGEGRLLFLDLLSGNFEEFIPQEARFPFLFAVKGDQIGWVARRPVNPHLIWGSREEPDRQSAELQYWPIHAGFDEAGQIWLGGLDLDWEGVGVGNEEGFTLDPRFSSHATTCIVPDAGGLWICSDGFAEGYEVWRVDGEEEPLPFYRLSYLEGPRDCPPESAVARICPDAWELVEAEIARGDGSPALPPSGGDGDGANDGGDDDAQTGDPDLELPDWVRPPEGDLDEDSPDPPSPTSGGCRNRSDGHEGAFLLLLAIFGLRRFKSMA